MEAMVNLGATHYSDKDVEFTRFRIVLLYVQKGFLKIAGPLHYLTKKEVKLEWIEMCEQCFQELKKKLTSTLILTLPGNEGFKVYSSTSHQGLGCVLMQY